MYIFKKEEILHSYLFFSLYKTSRYQGFQQIQQQLINKFIRTVYPTGTLSSLLCQRLHLASKWLGC